MPFSAGDKLGPYEITGPLGAGGMGDVYRALDPRLGREVAIKVSAEQFTERFEREARAVAALNHPNICTLYDVGPNYLVMELIEGENLQGPLSLPTALDYARQIAAALQAAHEKGIVHRDLKPGNIKVKPDGSVKVLDFGLAKISTPASGNQNPQNSPTLTLDSTRAGVILGTAAYMPPEQARGEPVDQRADIWAFGVVLYEMLAGERMFEARTVSDTLAAVLLKEPDLDRVPEQVRPLLRRCLAKEPKQRLHHIADVLLLLEESAVTPPAPVAASAPPRSGKLAWSAVAVLGLALAAVSFLYFRQTPPAAEVVRFQVFPPENTSFLVRTQPLLSPDGRRLAFQTETPDGRSQLWLRSLDSLESKPLAGTEGIGGAGFWSPDSRFFGFPQQNKLMKVEVSGGPPQTVCELPGGWSGGAWSGNGTIVFGSIVFGASGRESGLWQVSESGGAPLPLTRINASRRETFHAGPEILPDGRHFLYYREGGESRGIYVGSLDAKPEQQSSTRLLASSAVAVFAPASSPASGSGHVLFRQEGSLMAQAFDARRLELDGEAVPIAEFAASLGGPRPFSASTTGILAYRGFGSVLEGSTQLAWFDREGKALGTAGEPGQYNTLTLSPDGTRAAVSWAVPGTGFSRSDIWVYEFARGTRTRLTSSPGVDWLATWSPDGTRIVFSSERDGGIYNLYQKASSGVGNDDLLFKSNEHKSASDWSRDGRFLLYSVTVRGEPSDRLSSNDLWVLPLTPGSPGGGKPEPYLQTEFNEGQGRFSPDGRYVAYRSDSSGKDEVYVQPFPAASGGKWTVSQGGGSSPRWRGDGKELFYLSPDAKMMSVEVSTNPVFKAGVPKALFQTAIYMSGGPTRTVTRYDATADGKRFLINSRVVGRTAPPSPITVVLNWTRLLRK